MALFLFDIDGTLLRTGTLVHRAAFGHTFRAVYGLPLDLDGMPAGGRTDRWLLAEPLRRSGMAPQQIEELMPRAFEEMQLYTEQNLSDLRDRVLPGVPQVLDALQDHGHLLGLLTGNLSRIAHAKLGHAGLDAYFQAGGFGEESENRADLIPVALAAASAIAGEAITPARTVVVGDTPLDVEAGKAHGTLTVGVATGPATRESLEASGADLVLATMADHDYAARSMLRLLRA
ncbi:MAG TPA: HAD family hydrolase [Chloroflexota bacterium]|nr:HAD family hydrolase [Chloroflexota bacterium]